MNSPKPDCDALCRQVAGLEAWFDSIRTAGGYGGPSVGMRRTAARFCGPGMDWRWEGLLEGWCSRLLKTGDGAYADRLASGLEAIRRAQLPDGTFRNSYFDHNPFEGGMPHEPIVLAAVCRACRTLRQVSRPVPEGIPAMLARYVDEHLIKELWSKQLRTFKDWLQSDFESYTVAAVAAAVDLLQEYGELAGGLERYASFIDGAVDSILALQIDAGPLRGAFPLSNRQGRSVVPLYAARCLPVLQAVQRRTGSGRCAAAAEALVGFLGRCRSADGTYPLQVFAGRPSAAWPRVFGADAGIVRCLLRAGRSPEDAGVAAAVERLASAQSASGAVDTARGFGRRTAAASGPPDWRDVMPVAGWCDKVYALLAEVAPAGTAAFVPGPVEREVTVRGRPAVFRETDKALTIEAAGGAAALFRWTKGAQWAEACLL